MTNPIAAGGERRLIDKDAAIQAVDNCLDSHSERWRLNDGTSCIKACSCHSIIAAIEALPIHPPAMGGEGSELRDALSWMLPMAKGYAAANPVGKNDRIVAHAEAVLKRADDAASTVASGPIERKSWCGCKAGNCPDDLDAPKAASEGDAGDGKRPKIPMEIEDAIIDYGNERARSRRAPEARDRLHRVIASALVSVPATVEGDAALARMTEIAAEYAAQRDKYKDQLDAALRSPATVEELAGARARLEDVLFEHTTLRKGAADAITPAIDGLIVAARAVGAGKVPLEIQRYRMTIYDDVQSACVESVESADGEWVRYADLSRVAPPTFGEGAVEAARTNLFAQLEGKLGLTKSMHGTALLDVRQVLQAAVDADRK